jgi:hypothetical protein
LCGQTLPGRAPWAAAEEGGGRWRGWEARRLGFMWLISPFLIAGHSSFMMFSWFYHYMWWSTVSSAKYHSCGPVACYTMNTPSTKVKRSILYFQIVDRVAVHVLRWSCGSQIKSYIKVLPSNFISSSVQLASTYFALGENHIDKSWFMHTY